MGEGTRDALSDIEKIGHYKYREKRRLRQNDQDHSDYPRGGELPFRFGTAERLRTHASRVVRNIGQILRDELELCLFEFPIRILWVFQIPEWASAPDFR